MERTSGTALTSCTEDVSTAIMPSSPPFGVPSAAHQARIAVVVRSFARRKGRPEGPG